MSQDPPKWLTDIVVFPAARDTHPGVRARAIATYLDPAVAADQAAHDEKVLAMFRATPGPVNHMSLSGETYVRANFNRVIDGKPLIHHLIDRRDLTSLIMLVAGRTEAGVMISRTDTDMNGIAPLEYAIAEGWAEGEQYLRNYGFTDTQRGSTYADNHQIRVDRILRHALEQSDESLLGSFKAALLLGADYTRPVRGNLSPLHLAVVTLKKSMAEALIASGADLHSRTPRGETTLQLLWWCHPPMPLSKAWYDMVEMLRAAGAPPEDFKLPREMTAAELFLPVPGAPANTRGIDVVLRAGDYDAYKRGLRHLGPGLLAELTQDATILSMSPLRHLCMQDRLDVAFDPAVWQGQPVAMRAAWANIAEIAAAPNRFRDNQPASLTARHFNAALVTVQQGVLAAKAPRHLRLGGPPRPGR